MSERRYSRDHLWWEPDGRVGVTRHLLSFVHPIERLELPEPGSELRVAEPFGCVVGAKSAVDLYAPCRGRVVATNSDLLADPARLGERPEEVWLLRAEGEPGRLLDAEAYGRLLEGAASR